ncbi:hypothetical protein [Micromonospora endophytica]|uniref:Uncharacterized protein n=1 Tax=Micromonospora endophytica TaxID=515350 RepID=A0A2W2CX73_9ACTN|nr:hypothetical protein [Micromonospora endophytica]PZF96188.1 hypothetical protein C1I93_14290 [Micromonospora endophytica]RIW43497.1 hypothetical protein D3H59_20145 [Micromonospora endophytica]BCJ62876.1 hypothetical protein Jiend_62980 [Micromonospora endophytica]
MIPSGSPSRRPGQGGEPQSWLDRRREKIRDEIARNRRGEYVVPTWVLASTLALIVGAWIALIIFA